MGEEKLQNQLMSTRHQIFMAIYISGPQKILFCAKPGIDAIMSS